MNSLTVCPVASNCCESVVISWLRCFCGIATFDQRHVELRFAVRSVSVTGRQPTRLTRSSLSFGEGIDVLPSVEFAVPASSHRANRSVAAVQAEYGRRRHGRRGSTG